MPAFSKIFKLGTLFHFRCNGGLHFIVELLRNVEMYTFTKINFSIEKEMSNSIIFPLSFSFKLSLESISQQNITNFWCGCIVFAAERRHETHHNMVVCL